MSIKTRLKRLEKKVGDRDYKDMANFMILNVVLPPIEGEEMSAAQAVEWLNQRQQIETYEQQTGRNIFQPALHEILSSEVFAGMIPKIDYPAWPKSLKKYGAPDILTAYLIDKFELYEYAKPQKG